MACWNVIATSELSSSAATITIGSIPSSYDHLYLTFSSRNGQSAYYQYLMYEFNGDNDFDYSYTNLATAEMDVLTGIDKADMYLRHYIKRKAILMAP